jgi:hypothetical protein
LMPASSSVAASKLVMIFIGSPSSFGVAHVFRRSMVAIPAELAGA